jgi:hypothetical protein
MGKGASLGKEAVLADSGWVGEVVAWARGNRRPSLSGATRMTVGRPGREWSRWEPDAGVPHVRIGGGGTHHACPVSYRKARVAGPPQRPGVVLHAVHRDCMVW